MKSLPTVAMLVVAIFSAPPSLAQSISPGHAQFGSLTSDDAVDHREA